MARASGQRFQEGQEPAERTTCADVSGRPPPREVAGAALAEAATSTRPEDGTFNKEIALKLLANQQTGGDSQVENQERGKEVRRGGQLLEKKLGGDQGGQAQVHQGNVPECGHLGGRVDTSWRC